MRISWNNSLRCNRAVRMQKRDPLIASNAAYDQGDALFDRYAAISSRLDLLSEFDLSYRERYGLRVTGAAWYDTAYGTHGRDNPAALGAGAAPSSYVDGRFTPYVRHYYKGPWGELLDAFVFGSFDAGQTVWSVKAGRHALVWGESLFGSAHAVSYSQAPSDGLKALASPGASAKETALPLNQVSLQTQLSPELSVAAQLGFEWRPNRIAEGGTFFGAGDGVNEGPDVNRLSPVKGGSGDAGLGLYLRPAWLDGMLGFYVRRFDDKGGWLAQAAGGGLTRAVYARDIGLVGVTLSKLIGGASVGAEFSHRSGDPLVSDAAASAGAAGGYKGARGDTWHGLLNAVKSFGPGPLSDTSVLSAEVAWSGLRRVTHEPQLYRARGYLASCDTSSNLRGCADKEFMSLALSFVPTWLQVYPGVDLDMPLFFSRNFGNAPSNGGGSDGFTAYKAGFTAKAYARHQFDLAYTGYWQKIGKAPDSVFGSRVLGAPYKDKGWLSFTYQFAF
ncbi:MAG: DUF1302 family protein [Elusimicrobia bacterium]|nr:DUF1302 family protein [Elusimicrobiota bacterium]